MIWDFIRDFLVQYIFGGMTSDRHIFGGFIGEFVNIDGDYDVLDTNTLHLSIGEVFSGNNDNVYTFISLGDWLSTTATIIIMCLAVFLMIMLVRWVWRLVTSAFLLK